jgi:hypothetical protein
VAVVDLVQIEEEDFIFAEPALDLLGEDHLSNLAPELSLGVEEHLLHELHRDRAGALLDATGAHVDPGRSHDRDVVDAGVLEETAVLGGDERQADVVGERAHGHEYPLFLRDFGDLPALAVVHEAREVGLVVGDVVEIGEVAQEVEVDERAARPGSKGDQERQHE